MEAIKRFSKEIANEIIQRVNFDVEEISTMIQVRLKDSLKEILNESRSKEEAEYLKLLTIQKLHRPGSSQYVKVGYDLSLAKKRLASVNRSLNNIRREDKFSDLKRYVIASFGEESMDNFYKQLQD